MKVTILGCGSPESDAARASSGYLVETGDACILLDCGGGVVSRLIESGRCPADVTHLVFSHLHSDHMIDYARLVHAAWDEGGAPIRVYGPPPIAAITEGLFGREGVLAHDLRARTEHPASQEVWRARGGSLPRPWPAPDVTEIGPGFALEDEGWRITTCEALHAQPLLDCLAIAVEADGAKLVYSGDAALSEDVEALAAGADLLLHWCYRLERDDVPESIASMSPSPRQIVEMASTAGVRHVVLTHLRSSVRDVDALAEVPEVDIAVSVARDLMVLDL